MKSVANYTPHPLHPAVCGLQSNAFSLHFLVPDVIHFTQGVFLIIKKTMANMTRRMWFLFGALIVAAMPLVWLSLDSNAGEVLLRLTQPAAVRDYASKPTRGSTPSTVSVGTLSMASPALGGSRFNPVRTPSLVAGFVVDWR